MDPFVTLGVSRSSSQEEIDKAFKALMEKYSTDNYAGGPMEGLAAKKRKELEDAYDGIIKIRNEEKQRASANQQSTYNTYNGQSNGASQQTSGGDYTKRPSSPEYEQIKRLIDSGNTIEAQRLLQGFAKRDAEWYYLSGCLALRNGMYNDAYSFFRTASNKDPQNDEYRAAYMRMEQQAGGYRNYGGNMQQQDCCNCCSNLLIADCCCECLGGDLISCC